MGLFSYIATSEPSPDVTQALSNGLTDIAGDLTSTVTTVLPIILGVVGMVMVVKFGLRFFKTNSKPN